LRQAAGRSFVRIAGGWWERGLSRETKRRRVEAASLAGRAMLARMPELAGLLRDGGVVVLRDGGKIIELRDAQLVPR
jgi:urease accessory protein UreE